MSTSIIEQANINGKLDNGVLRDNNNSQQTSAGTYNSNLYTIYFRKGISHAKQGDIKEAEACFKQAIALKLTDDNTRIEDVYNITEEAWSLIKDASERVMLLDRLMGGMRLGSTASSPTSTVPFHSPYSTSKINNNINGNSNSNNNNNNNNSNNINNGNCNNSSSSISNNFRDHNESTNNLLNSIDNLNGLLSSTSSKLNNNNSFQIPRTPTNNLDPQQFNNSNTNINNNGNNNNNISNNLSSNSNTSFLMAQYLQNATSTNNTNINQQQNQLQQTFSPSTTDFLFGTTYLNNNSLTSNNDISFNHLSLNPFQDDSGIGRSMSFTQQLEQQNQYESSQVSILKETSVDSDNSTTTSRDEYNSTNTSLNNAVSNGNASEDNETKLSVDEEKGDSSMSTVNTSNSSKNQQLKNMRATNVMAYKSLWIGSISPKCKRNILERVFEKYGKITSIHLLSGRLSTIGTISAFVNYDNPESPINAICDLKNKYIPYACLDRKSPLQFRLTPDDQHKRFLNKNEAKLRTAQLGECFYWRNYTRGCLRGDKCEFHHIPMNRAIDNPPWLIELS